jgi:hypothetical protein
MTRTQGVIVCLFLLFFAAHLVAIDIIGIRILMEANNDPGTSFVTDTESPLCDPEGDVCP